jgi:hypothetical protein
MKPVVQTSAAGLFVAVQPRAVGGTDNLLSVLRSNKRALRSVDASNPV